MSGIPDGAFTRVVREDPVRRGLLYAGTETRALRLLRRRSDLAAASSANLPVVPVTDLAVKDDDLVVATQGRSFWILDDVTPLRAWKPAIAAKDLYLFAPRPAIRMAGAAAGMEEEPRARGVGKNPANGVLVYYWLKEKPPRSRRGRTSLTIEILDGDTVLRTFTSEKPTSRGEGCTSAGRRGARSRSSRNRA